MDFQYLSRPVRGSGCSDEWEEVLQGCECVGPCTAENKCLCLLGGENNYERDRLIDKFAKKPILECHLDCACNATNCSNRVLQKGITAKLKVMQTGTKGYGIKNMELIPINTFICEYAGEVLGEEEANKRFRENETEHNYIMTVRETCSGKTVTHYIDPRNKGNLARFLNHSCKPNLYQMAIRVGCPIPRIGFFASRDILPDEELTYSYGASKESGTKRCLCGTDSCLGYLPSDL